MRLIAVACGAAVAASLLFGGTSRGGVSGAIVSLAALPLLVALLLEPKDWLRGRGAALALVALAVAIALLQLVPLPPSLWSALPGRAAVVETYRAADLALPWAGLTVSAYATQRALFALLAPIVIFLGALACRREERRAMFGLVLIAGAGSALLEFLQIMDGADSALRFYRPSDGAVGVGLFANRNHAAALLYCTIPLAAIVLDPSRGRRPILRLAALAGFYLAILLGLMMTGSRSALIFGGVAFVLTFALILRQSVAANVVGGGRATAFAAGGLLLTVALLAPAFGLDHILERFVDHTGGAGDRASLARISFAAARGFFPFGSGLGTFERVYPLFETREAIAPAIVNHAHDDWLEIIIEAGLPGLLLLLGALVLFGVCVLRNRREPDAGARRERDAAAIVIALLLAHSLLDYPLRMPALSAVFAVGAASLYGAFGVDRRRRSGSGHGRI